MGDRHHKPEQQRYRAPQRRQARHTARQRNPQRHPLPAAAALVPPPRLHPLKRQQRERQRQHRQRNLRRPFDPPARGPGDIDRHRQRAHAEKLAGPDISQHLHHHQPQPNPDRRRRDRQGHPAQQHAAGRPQAARRLDCLRRLHQQRRPGAQIDIGIQREPHHQDRSPHRADIRQHQPADLGDPCNGPQRRLHRPDRVQHVHIGVGDDIGRHRQRQQQRPFQPPPPGKAEPGHQPGGSNPGDRRHHGGTGQQHRGLPQRIRQHIGGNMRPKRAVAAQRQYHQPQHRRQHQQGRHGGGGEQAAMLGVMLHQCPRGVAYWSKPTLSTIMLAAARPAATSENRTLSTRNAPRWAMAGCSGTFGNSGNSKLASA